MKTTLHSILIFSVLLANAQKEKKQTIVAEKFVTIRMSTLPIAEFPKNSIPVSGITVIQSVKDSFRMGYALKGMDNSVATLKFAKPLSLVLQEQVKRMYKHEYKKGGAEILWVVKNLRFGAKSGATANSFTRIVTSPDCSYTRFNADAYISDDGNLFKKLSTIDTVFVLLNTGDGFGLDLENAIRVLLKRTLFAADIIPEQSITKMTIQEISNAASQQVNIPILIDSNYLDGIYTSFEEFLANKPSRRDYETVSDKKKKIKFTAEGQNGQKDTLEIWGLCKNGKIYKYHAETLIPIKKEGNRFIISDYVEETTRLNNKNANMGLGVAVGSGLLSIPIFFYQKSGKPLLVESIPYIDDPEKQPIATCIDMKTGELSF